ncbi:hypothetical protein MP34_15275 [Escherichia coli N37122PS]|nr:hypothetical protein MP34_15275 [Escherichia coli N37122PS]
MRLFIYSPAEAAQSPALQISASTWGLNGKVIFIIQDLKEIAMVGELPPAGAVNPSIKRR